MIECLDSIRLIRCHSDPARMFCRLDATHGARAAAGKCHRPGTGAQKIGSGPLSAEHKLWWVEATQEQRGMSEWGRPSICKPEHADLSRKSRMFGTSSSYLVKLQIYYRRRGFCSAFLENI